MTDKPRKPSRLPRWLRATAQALARIEPSTPKITRTAHSTVIEARAVDTDIDKMSESELLSEYNALADQTFVGEDGLLYAHTSNTLQDEAASRVIKPWIAEGYEIEALAERFKRQEFHSTPGYGVALYFDAAEQSAIATERAVRGWPLGRRDRNMELFAAMLRAQREGFIDERDVEDDRREREKWLEEQRLERERGWMRATGQLPPSSFAEALGTSDQSIDSGKGSE